ncbi:MAG: hypothetical protein AAF600_13070 [Bacteroidota bacterium]
MIEVKEIDALRIELLQVVSKSPFGSSFEAARRNNISYDAELKIRQGKLLKKDTPSNHQKMRQLIHTYKLITEEHKKQEA